MTLPKSTLAADREVVRLLLNRPISTLTTERLQSKDSLALGLCCCDRSPRLVALVVKYFSHYFGLEVVSDYHRLKPILHISDDEPYADYKKQLIELMTVFPVKKLTSQIQSLFPLRQQNINNTLNALDAIGTCFNLVIEEYGSDVELGVETLEMMRREYLKLEND